MIGCGDHFCQRCLVQQPFYKIPFLKMSTKLWCPSDLSLTIMTSPRNENYIKTTIESLLVSGDSWRLLRDITIVTDSVSDENLEEISKKSGIRVVPRTASEEERIAGFTVHRRACDNYFRNLTIPTKGYRGLI